MAKKKQQKGVSLTAYAALTTYSDLLSLLLTLFVLLYALSEPRRPQLMAALSSIRQHMQGVPSSPPPGPSIRPQQMTPSELGVLRRGPPGKRTEVASMADGERQKLVIGGEGFFSPGSVELSARAKRVIQSDVAPDLRGFKNRIEVIGHTAATDDESTDVWTLGAARARAVMRFLVDECGIEESRFRIMSAGSNEPRDPANPALNRRVEIIMSDLLLDD